jgi:hypothetical protein
MKLPSLILHCWLPLICAAAPEPVIRLQDQNIAALRSGPLDLQDRMAVLSAVWAALPAEVTVHPTENYCYWQMQAQGRELRGNLRLASGQREKGFLNFGYAEWVEFPGETEPDAALTVSGQLGAADGVTVKCPDHFTAEVTFREKKVRFRLQQIPQTPPQQFQPGADEVFIQRTQDESGCRFFLMFDQRANCFFWVLNEEETVPDSFHSLAPDIVAGRRTGFIFWQQPGRKVLAAVRKLSVQRNDYCDGPFDQLADNYARETNIQQWMERALPPVRGRIDVYGYFTGTPNPKRVALNACAHYDSPAAAVQFIQQAKTAQHPLAFISSGNAADSAEK